MKESRDNAKRRTLKSAYRVQENLVEHRDAGTPTHGVNEALGDIFRELTNPDPAESYIESKVNLLKRFVQEQERRPLNEPYEMSIRNYARDPKVKDTTRKYLRRNKLFRGAIAKMPLPGDRRGVMLHLADAQRVTAEATLENEGSHSPLVDRTLNSIINEVETRTLKNRVKKI